jgi:C-methyltransferase
MSNQAGQQQNVSPESIFHALQGFQATAVLGTAIRLGLFDAVARGVTAVDALAGAVGADRRGLTVLVDALTALGFLVADKDGVRLAPVTERFLVRDGGAYLGGLADVFFTDWQWRGHLSLPEAVRRGGTVGGDQNVEELEHPFWTTFVDAWSNASFPTAHAMAAQLAEWAKSRDRLEILDVACGNGIYGATLAGQHQSARVTFLDQANVIPGTRAWAGRLGVADRAAYLEGDMFKVPLAGPYDVALASHVFHHFGPEACVALLRRIAGALKPGGKIAIHDFIVTTRHAQEPAAALFAVIMLVRTRQGRVYSVTDYEALLAEAGFAAPELHDIPGLPTRLIVATRR